MYIKATCLLLCGFHILKARPKALSKSKGALSLDESSMTKPAVPEQEERASQSATLFLALIATSPVESILTFLCR